jgi:putative ABC transport system permease protein
VTDAETGPGHEGSGLAPSLAIARSEIRSRWLGLVLIGLLAGTIGAVSVSGIALARRTSTAYDRLGEATGVEDVSGMVVGYPDLAEDVLDLPGVTESWVGGIGIGKVEGENTFMGIVAGPRLPSELKRPIVLEGRLPGAAADPEVIEIALRDDFQREFDVPLGIQLPVQFLSEGDLFRFDSGFEGGVVHGPTATLEVVGTVRLAGDAARTPPALASGAALTSHREAFVGTTWFARLRDGAAGFDEFQAAAEALEGGRTLPPEAAEFSVIDAYDTSLADAAIDNTASLLGRALMVFALSTAGVGGVAIVQALARHHAATARAREVEQALGLTRTQQVTARLLSGLLPTLIATVLTTAGALLAARIEPIGAIHRYEPHPGATLNIAVIAIGVATVFVGVLGTAALAGALRRSRRTDATAVRESVIVNRVTRVGGSPPGVLGLRFALEAGRGARSVPVRSAITGAVLGIAGVVGGLVFVASLERLVESPARSAIPYDVGVADVTAEDLEAEVMDSPLVGDVSAITSAPLSIEGLRVEGHALEALRGSLDIGIDDGRMPRTPDEITIGLRVARDLGVEVGDTVTARRADGTERELAVVGRAVVPTFNGEELGTNALLTPEGLVESATAAPFFGAAVEAAPGADVGELTELLASTFEADSQRIPTAVQNLEQLGGLPAGVAAIVGSIAVLALANALVVAVRRRSRDLAVMRAMGFTRGQTAGTVVVMALAIVAIGAAVGVPVGMAVGASIWRATAAGAFVLSDASFRWQLIVLPVLGAVAIALVAATLPAHRAARQSAAEGLRAE